MRALPIAYRAHCAVGTKHFFLPEVPTLVSSAQDRKNANRSCILASMRSCAHLMKKIQNIYPIVSNEKLSPRFWRLSLDGSPHLEIFKFSVNATPYFYLVLFFVGFIAYLMFKICDSKFGRAMAAIREDELAASCMGVPTLKIKLQAFGLSAFIAGIAGAIFASKQTIITPDSFDFVLSVLILAMVVLGGMGNIWGVALGALILGVLPEILRELAAYRMLLFGLIMILMMIFRPQGILGGQLIKRELQAKQKGVIDGAS